MRKINLKPEYDLIVVGGGIQGCAMLWEAQSRGLNTLLVEAQDYCSQTSANSLKTIHGGIRYLQTLNLARTWRSSKEPETLLKIAPHLVHQLPCLLPTQKRLKRSRLAVTAGFSFYNLIKKFSCPAQQLPKARCLTKPQLSALRGLPDLDNVTGAGLWFDAQVQHAQRLGLAFVKTAQHSGAHAFNYLKATSLTKSVNKSVDVVLVDQIDGQSYRVNAGSLIYCTASNTPQNLTEIHNADYPKFCLAMNLVINKKYSDYALGLQSGFARQPLTNARRLLFSAPWRSSTLFGTWYFPLASGNTDNQTPTPDQINVCIADVNQSYPGINLVDDDIGRVHAGLLPVKGNRADPEFDLMEHDLISQPNKAINLFTVIPTKFTTCRATAQTMIDRLSENTNNTVCQSISAAAPLNGGENIADFNSFAQQCKNNYSAILSEPVIDQLCVSYGSQINEIIALCEENKALLALIPGSNNHIKAQLIYELNNGQVFKSSDFIERRSFICNSGPLDKHCLAYCDETINSFHAMG